jgi:replication gene A protein
MTLRTSPAPMAPGETLGEYRRLPFEELARRGAEQFAATRTRRMHSDFAARLIAKWRTDWSLRGADAMREHVERCTLLDNAERAGLPSDAWDAEIVQRAKDSARDAGRRIELIGATWRAYGADVVMEHTLSELRDWFARIGLADAWARLDARKADGTRKRPPRSILLRVQCERYWRRTLRALHARAVESVARSIGLVHRRAGCYVSDVSMRMHRARQVRNTAVLRATVGVNERGQAIDLAELSALNVSNPAIRRAELMTRIAGFELIARELDHVAYFVTVTCPSHMHAWRTAGFAGAEENPAFDQRTDVKAAQGYLCHQWRNFGSAAARAGLQLYGFRIAEPNHDGTPHWHCLLFFPRTATAQPTRRNPHPTPQPSHKVLVTLLRRYFLFNDSPDERGAATHRVQVKRINWGRGSAAGYIAKYVAKNIDGYAVGKDLLGHDAIESSQRVAAWASQYGIRQFQQIGGAPVGVWRELRRVHEDQADASAGLALALDAVNVGPRDDDGPSPAALGWTDYLHLQGGHRVRRGAERVRLLNEPTGELGRYAEPILRRIVGIATDEVRRHTIAQLGIVCKPFEYVRTQRIEVESERCAWVVIQKSPAPDVHARDVAKARERMQTAGQRATLPPWTRVNNCARRSEQRDAWLSLSPQPLFPPAVVRHRKTGQFRRRRKGTHDDDHEKDGA